jgi:hypothetical protein
MSATSMIGRLIILLMLAAAVCIPACHAGEDSLPASQAGPAASDSVFPWVDGAASVLGVFGSDFFYAEPPEGETSQACWWEYNSLREEVEKRGKMIKAAVVAKASSNEDCMLMERFNEAYLRMIEYVEANFNSKKCGIPPELPAQLKTVHKESEAMQKKVCTAGTNGRDFYAASYVDNFLSTFRNRVRGGATTDAKTDKPKEETIDWKPDSKLEWKNFKGGKPPAQYAKIVTSLAIDAAACKDTTAYKITVRAQMFPESSGVDPEVQSPEALGHEQLHFDIAQKHAVALNKAFDAIFSERCKRKYTDGELETLRRAIAAEYRAFYAEQARYDDETKHGKKTKKQQEWAEKIAKDLGRPAPAPLLSSH